MLTQLQSIDLAVCSFLSHIQCIFFLPIRGSQLQCPNWVICMEVTDIRGTLMLDQGSAGCSSLPLTFSFVVQAATVSLGLIGAGTNNARIAGMLRNLSSYYYKDPSLLFCVLLLSYLLWPFFLLYLDWLHLCTSNLSFPLCKLFCVNAGENCTGSCAHGKRVVDSQSLPFRPLLAVQVCSDHLLLYLTAIDKTVWKVWSKIVILHAYSFTCLHPLLGADRVSGELWHLVRAIHVEGL